MDKLKLDSDKLLDIIKLSHINSSFDINKANLRLSALYKQILKYKATLGTAEIPAEKLEIYQIPALRTFTTIQQRNRDKITQKAAEIRSHITDLISIVKSPTILPNQLTMVVSFLENIRDNPKDHVIFKNIEQALEIADIIKHNDNVQHLSDINKERQAINNLIDIKSKLVRFNDEYTTLQAQIEEYKVFQTLQVQYNTYIRDYKQLQAPLQHLQDQKNIYLAYVDSRNLYNTIASAISYSMQYYTTQLHMYEHVEKRLCYLKKIYRETNIQLNTTTIQSSSISNTIKEYNKYMQLLNEAKERQNILLNQKELLSQYIYLVSKNGIPSSLLSQKIDSIEKHVNVILLTMNTSMVCSIKIEQNKNGKKQLLISITKDSGLILDIPQLSGYERFILTLAFKSALHKNSMVNKGNILCIDEGLDCIDEVNINKLDLLVSILLKTYSNILVVSHIPYVKSWRGSYCETIDIVSEKDSSGRRFSHIEYV